MTLRIPAASIAPELWFGVAEALAGPCASVAIGDVTLHAQGCLPPWPDVPRYLRYADREAIVVAEGVERLADLEACLIRVVREISGCGSFSDLDAAVVALDAVDRCFRDRVPR